MTDADSNAITMAVFVAIGLLVGVDLVADAGAGAGGVHVGSEAVAALLALLGAGWSVHRVVVARQEAARWRAQAEELLAGVGQTVEHQFAAWRLTGAEQEVGLLLLKGLAFKEVAQVRQTSERTAREQARAIYRKAGLGGRAELSAWFIEDLLPGERDR